MKAIELAKVLLNHPDDEVGIYVRKAVTAERDEIREVASVGYGHFSHPGVMLWPGEEIKE